MTWLTVSYAWTWPEVSDLQAALVCAVACAVLGWFAPRLIARLPEPEPPEDTQDPGEHPGEGHRRRPRGTPSWSPAKGSSAPSREVQEDRKAFARTLPPPPPKELYSDIAALPTSRLKLAAWSARDRGAFGLVLGWTGALVYLVPLVPIGVVLLVIDWRTTLLPDADHPPDVRPARGADPAGCAARPRPRRALPRRLGLAGHRRLVLDLLVAAQRLGVRRRTARPRARSGARLPRLGRRC